MRFIIQIKDSLTHTENIYSYPSRKIKFKNDSQTQYLSNQDKNNLLISLAQLSMYCSFDKAVLSKAFHDTSTSGRIA